MQYTHKRFIYLYRESTYINITVVFIIFEKSFASLL